MKERDIERYLVRRVKELGGECRKVKWIGRSGAPDRLVMLPPQNLLAWDNVIHPGAVRLREPFSRVARTIWVELKAPGEKATAAQQREHQRMRAMGQCVEVVDSFERVDEVLA